MRLKIAAMMLFWFGIILESVMLGGSIIEYLRHQTLFGADFTVYFSDVEFMAILIYNESGHFIHIVAGYLLAKGNKKGLALALSISALEAFLAPIFNLSNLETNSTNIAFRIFFGILFLLIVIGIRSLAGLQKEDWRPWKNPFASKHGDSLLSS